MISRNNLIYLLSTLLIVATGSCKKEIVDPGGGGDGKDTLTGPLVYALDEFVMGADLSYVNQLLDRGGSYAEDENPYQIFADHGCNLVRLRLWNNPQWYQVINDADYPLYNHLPDVISAALEAKQAGMAVCLDLHYSDNWADPGQQRIPAAWKDLSLELLADSVYAFTRQVLLRMKEMEVLPAFIQLGNEINTGMLHPVGHYENNNWQNLGTLLNAGIRAVKEVRGVREVPKIIIHVAGPEHIRWFFNGITAGGGVEEFEVIGISYYPIWSEVSLGSLSGYLKTARSDFGKEIMIMETAYPWTGSGVDDYYNLFGPESALPAYPFSADNQLAVMKKITQAVIDAGGIGVVYWEPAFISTPMKTQWGTGSPWENCAFFDFNNNNATLPGIDFMRFRYNFD